MKAARRQMAGVSLALVLLVMLSTVAAKELTEDWKDSKDHPLISRFTGALISGYESIDFADFVLPLGPYKKGDAQLVNRFAKAQVIAGKLTRITYAVPAGKSVLEVFGNYQQALSRAGFETLFACAADCGGFDFTRVLRSEVINRRFGNDSVIIDTLTSNRGEVRHLSAVLRRAAGDVYASVTVAGSGTKPAGVLLSVVESRPMQAGQVTVDAEAIATALKRDGRIALYGVLFDVDRAEVRADSRPALEEMAKFLKGQPRTKVHIVGHTDNSGAPAYNLDLSQRRAESVVATLVGQYGIPAAQLNAKGLGSFAPIATNRNEAGRARNRRVELVEQ